MRAVLYAAAAILLVGITSADAAQRRDERRYARDTRDGADGRDDYRVDRRDARGSVHIVFSTGDRRMVREYYEPRYRSRRLPPGLQKKYARTGYLPPGWQRKMQPLPWSVERRLGVLPREYRRGVIDDHAVIYVPRSGVIIDATVLF